jgi:hypothetical protein
MAQTGRSNVRYVDPQRRYTVVLGPSWNAPIEALPHDDRAGLGLGGGPPGFARDFSGPVLLGIPPGSRLSFAYGGVTLCADAFQASSATPTIFYFLPAASLTSRQ